jgi:hypothetical protein
MSGRGRHEAPSVDPALVHLRQAGVRLARLCVKHFRISRANDRFEVGQDVAERDVLDFLAEYTAAIRPVGLSPTKAFPVDPPGLTTFLWATPTPDAVLNDVVRLALYTDRTVIVDPFSRHVAGRPHKPGERGPFRETSMWVQTFANWALMVTALEPWIEAGLVVLIPEPQNFLTELPPFEGIARDAMGRGLFDGMAPASVEDMLEAAALTSADDADLKAVVNLALPELDDAELAEVVAGLSTYRASHPSRFLPSKPEHAALITSGSGQNVFEAAWIADKLGGYLVPRGNAHTEIFRRVSRGLDQDDHDALVTAFAAARLPMLNNVSLAIALELRQSTRLQHFRHYLEEVWAASTAVDSDAKSPDRARDLAQRLLVEHEQAADEWASIYKDLGIKGTATLFAGPIAQVVDAHLLLAVAGAAFWTFRGWSTAARAHRRTPAALLVELEHASSPNPLKRLAAKLERHA